MNHKTFTKLSKVLGVLLLVSTVCNLTSLHGEVPKLINFEGKLTEKDGTTPISGLKTITFRIYESADAGIHIWFETREVTIDNGFYNVLLGSVEPFDPQMKFDNAYWLSVQVSGEDEMKPRYQIGAAPYAINADMIDGKDSTKIVPSGVIVMWSGTLASIPSGWHLCDGTNGTPDLRDKFIYGVSSGENPGATGGATYHSHNYSNVPRHTHGISDPGHSHRIAWKRTESVDSGGFNIPIYWPDSSRPGGSWKYTDSAKTGITVNSAGVSSPSTDPASSLPPYYKLAFIMKF